MKKKNGRITGKPLNNRRTKLSIPVGIEKALYRAAVDPGFRRRLLEDRMQAVESANMTLRPSELMVLRNVSESALTKMIERIRPKRHGGRRFMKAVAAAVVTLATGTAGVACDDKKTGSKDTIEDSWDDIIAGGAMPDLPDDEDLGLPDIEEEEADDVEDEAGDITADGVEEDMHEDETDDEDVQEDAEVTDAEDADIEPDAGDALDDDAADDAADDADDADDAVEDPSEDSETED